jgi:hypothetical protein
MKRQRADYRFVTFTGGKPNQFWGYGFYDSEMEDIYDDGEDDDSEGGYESDRDKNRRVELALAPALERCGSANGHVFDQSFILVKADVSCKRLQKPVKPVNPKGGRGSRNSTKSFGSLWKRKEYD